MYKKILMALVIIGGLTFNAVANAEFKSFTGVGGYYMDVETKTLDEIKENAKTLAAIDVLGKVILYISADSRVENFNLSKDEIETIVAGVVRIMDVRYNIIKDEVGYLLIEAKITAEIDTDEVLELVERERR